MDHGYCVVDLGFRVSAFPGDFDSIVDRLYGIGSAATFVMFGVLNVILRLFEKWNRAETDFAFWRRSMAFSILAVQRAQRYASREPRERCTRENDFDQGFVHCCGL